LSFGLASIECVHIDWVASFSERGADFVSVCVWFTHRLQPCCLLPKRGPPRACVRSGATHSLVRSAPNCKIDRPHRLPFSCALSLGLVVLSALRLKTDRSLGWLVLAHLGDATAVYSAGPRTAATRGTRGAQHRPNFPRAPRTTPEMLCTWLSLCVCVCALAQVRSRLSPYARARARSFDILRGKSCLYNAAHSLLCKLPANTFMLRSLINCVCKHVPIIKSGAESRLEQRDLRI
jgi:hypothetical protein